MIKIHKTRTWQILVYMGDRAKQRLGELDSCRNGEEDRQVGNTYGRDREIIFRND